MLSTCRSKYTRTSSPNYPRTVLHLNVYKLMPGLEERPAACESSEFFWRGRSDGWRGLSLLWNWRPDARWSFQWAHHLIWSWLWYCTLRQPKRAVICYWLVNADYKRSSHKINFRFMAICLVLIISKAFLQVHWSNFKKRQLRNFLKREDRIRHIIVKQFWSM